MTSPALDAETVLDFAAGHSRRETRLATFLFGYDVEYMADPGLSVEATAQLIDVHESRKVPATFFLLGSLLDARRDQWRRVFDRPDLDIAQHTWSHCLVVDHQVFGHAADEAQACEEVARTRDLIQEVLGRDTIGLTSPCGNHGGLRHQEVLLWTLWDEGIRYVRSDTRGPGDTLPAPMTRPYWYEEEGTPLMLETCGHGWHDCSLNGYTSDRLAWPPPPGTAIPPTAPTTAEEVFRVYRVSVDYALANDLVCVLCLHPWSLARIDAQMTTARLLVDHIIAQGGTICSFQQFYEQELAKRPRELVEAEQRRETERRPAEVLPAPDHEPPTPSRQNVPIVWDDLLMALETHWSSGERYFLDCRTGQIEMVSDFGMDGEEHEGLFDLMDADPDRYVEVEPLDSREAYDHMVEFIETVPEKLLREEFEVAIQGKGAFRQFKDVLARHPAQRERWFRFKQQQMEQAALRWLDSAGITSVRRITFGEDADVPDT